MKLETIELKFLLKLLGQPSYKGAMGQLTLGKSALDRDRACQSLGRKGLVDYREEVKAFSITSSGKGLTNQDVGNLPASVISEQDLYVLQIAKKASSRVTPGKLTKIPADERQALIHNLADRGFLEISAKAMKEAWLTQAGDNFLRSEYNPQGGATISLNLLASYVTFLRQSPLGEEAVTIAEPLLKTVTDNISSAELLAAIAKLDVQYNTGNYLPLYYIREALPLSRQVMDQMLYDLQSRDEIELDTLQEVQDYTEEQLKAGIPQPVGGPLFFVSLPD